MAGKTPSFRMESDSLGEIAVPRNALWGAQTQRAIENFPLSGLRIPRQFIRALGLIKATCAEVNAASGTLDGAIAQAIAAVAEAVARGDYDEHFPIDVFQTGSGTSSNMNANEVIARLASERLKTPVHPNDHVNRSQSSNDVIPTAIHVSATLALHDDLFPSLQGLAVSLERRAEELKAVVKTGRTHLMDAMPLTFAQEVGAWASQIRHCIERLHATLPRLTALAQGGTAVGTGINTPADFGKDFAEALSARAGVTFHTAGNKFEAIATQDTAVELSGQLRVTAVSLLKIAGDLRWMNSGPLTGLAEIELPALQPGSSIMPGKVNPVVPEAISMACVQVMGNDVTVGIAGQSGNFQLNAMLPVIAYNLLQSIELLSNGAGLLSGRAIAGFTVNQAKIDKTLAQNPLLVTALTGMIGYDQAAAIAKRAITENRPIVDIAAEMTDLPREDLEKALNPRTLT